jgi:hypothetical protein
MNSVFAFLLAARFADPMVTATVSIRQRQVVSQERLGGLHHRYDRAASSGPTFCPSFYMCAARAHGFLPSKVCALCGSNDYLQAYYRETPHFSSQLKFWQDTGFPFHLDLSWHSSFEPPARRIEGWLRLASDKFYL